MFPASFGYHPARSVEEALDLLTKHGEEAKLLAGGQSLVPAMNFRLAQPAVLIDLNNIADLTYVKSDGNVIWLAFSSWFLLFGLLFGVLAALVLLVDFLRRPALRRAAGWAHLLFFYAALIVELFSIFIHERDGWTAVVPIGLTLSIVGVVLILIAGWLRRPAAEMAP